MTDILTTTEAADLLRVSKQSIYRWHKAGMLIGFVPPGTKKLLFRREDIIRFLYRTGNTETEIAKTGQQDVDKFFENNKKKGLE